MSRTRDGSLAVSAAARFGYCPVVAVLTSAVTCAAACWIPRIEVPGADGVTLLADHYLPRGDEARGTILVRTPYGRGFPWAHLYGVAFAEQGFHVLLQSCRGTGGSTGRFEPFRNEAADGQATVAWRREQDWFSGRLGTIGASYLGYTQMVLAEEPPPELKAAVVQVGIDDPVKFMYPGGAFALSNVLSGSCRSGRPAARRSASRRRSSTSGSITKSPTTRTGGRCAWHRPGRCRRRCKADGTTPRSTRPSASTPRFVPVGAR